MAGVSQRIQAISESATMAITAKANAMRAGGQDVIGYGAGEPDFPTPAAIVEAAVEAARTVAMHKYTPAPGLPALREAVAAKTAEHSNWAVTPSQVMITNGGKQGVFNTLQCLVDPGDEVLVPAPYWVTYPSAVELAGGVPVAISTDTSTGFKATPDVLEAARTDKTKVLIFVSPSNPTGAVYTEDEVIAIGQWAVEHGVWVMTDEIYEHLVYGGATFTSMPGVVPDIRDQCVIVNGVAKSYAMTGWRVGWMVGPEEVIKGSTKLQSHLTSNVSNVAQAAALQAVSGPLDETLMMREAFDRRRKQMFAMLDSMNGVSCLEPHGAFYCFPDMHGVLGRTLAGREITSTLDLADVVLEHAGVAFVPGEAFGAPGYARFSYSIDDADMVRGLERMGAFLAG